MFFAGEADAFSDEVDLGIRLDAGEAVAVDIGFADFCEDFVEEAAFSGGGAAGDEEGAVSEAVDFFGKVGEHAVSEVDFGGVMVDEIVGHEWFLSWCYLGGRLGFRVSAIHRVKSPGETERCFSAQGFHFSDFWRAAMMVSMEAAVCCSRR